MSSPFHHPNPDSLTPDSTTPLRIRYTASTFRVLSQPACPQRPPPLPTSFAYFPHIHPVPSPHRPHPSAARSAPASTPPVPRPGASPTRPLAPPLRNTAPPPPGSVAGHPLCRSRRRTPFQFLLPPPPGEEREREHNIRGPASLSIGRSIPSLSEFGAIPESYLPGRRGLVAPAGHSERTKV